MRAACKRACARRGLSSPTLPHRLEASFGQRGQTMLQVTPSGTGPANKALQLVWERGRSPFGCPRNNGPQKRRTSHVHNESAHDHRLHR
jgi:hypothetical protein